MRTTRFRSAVILATAGLLGGSVGRAEDPPKYKISKVDHTAKKYWLQAGNGTPVSYDGDDSWFELYLDAKPTTLVSLKAGMKADLKVSPTKNVRWRVCAYTNKRIEVAVVPESMKNPVIYPGTSDTLSVRAPQQLATDLRRTEYGMNYGGGSESIKVANPISQTSGGYTLYDDTTKKHEVMDRDLYAATVGRGVAVIDANLQHIMSAAHILATHYVSQLAGYSKTQDGYLLKYHYNYEGLTHRFQRGPYRWEPRTSTSMLLTLTYAFDKDGKFLKISDVQDENIFWKPFKGADRFLDYFTGLLSDAASKGDDNDVREAKKKLAQEFVDAKMALEIWLSYQLVKQKGK